MIGTNRDLAEMQRLLDREILLLKHLAAGTPAPSWIEGRLALTCRQRISVCAAMVNRRVEAAHKVVVFSRWVSGNGALRSFASEPDRAEKAGATFAMGGARGQTA